MAPLPCSNTGPFLPYMLVLLQASTWGRYIHSLSLYSDTPLPIPSPSDWPRLLLSQTFTCINTLAISSQLFFLFTQPMKMEQTKCSAKSAHKIQKPGNHPKERIQNIMICSSHNLLHSPFIHHYTNSVIQCN